MACAGYSPTADYVQAVQDMLVAEVEHSVKFGISTFITDEGIGAGPLAAAVESRGFSSLCVTEHSHIPVAPKEPIPGGGEVPHEYHRTMDPFVALALAAAVTRNLRLSTGILLLPQRDVIYTAKEISSLDVVSNGRLNVGVGVGWNRDEMRNHGTASGHTGREDERAARRAQTNLDPRRGGVPRPLHRFRPHLLLAQARSAAASPRSTSAGRAAQPCTGY